MRPSIDDLQRSVRAAIHATTSAPRLYRAGRRAGAPPADAARLLLTSAWILLVVAPRAAGAPGRQNAVRHFVWQSYTTARHGEAVARAVADAQEHGTPDAADSEVDARNNAIAQQYGATHATELASLSTGRVLQELLRVGLAKWDAGELSGGPAAARAARRRRRDSQDRATRRTRS